MITNSYSYNAYSDMKDNLLGVVIKSSGHIFAGRGRQILRPFGREDWLLFYVAKGSEHFYLDSGEDDAREGSFIFFRPGEPQKHICLCDKTAEFYFIHFFAPKNFDLFGFESSRVYHSEPSVHIAELFEEVISELQTKNMCYEKICVTMFFNIICRLERRMAALSNPHQKYLNEISVAIHSMNREYGKNYSLEDYAEMCHMSKFHFLRSFKKITGSTPHEYLSKIRTDHAAELLEDNSLSIGEVAARTGFASQSYFCDAFKKKTGLSPSAYREKYYL